MFQILNRRKTIQKRRTKKKKGKQNRANKRYRASPNRSFTTMQSIKFHEKKNFNRVFLKFDSKGYAQERTIYYCFMHDFKIYIFSNCFNLMNIIYKLYFVSSISSAIHKISSCEVVNSHLPSLPTTWPKGVISINEHDCLTSNERYSWGISFMYK